jgi:hypothetical protein
MAEEIVLQEVTVSVGQPLFLGAGFRAFGDHAKLRPWASLRVDRMMAQSSAFSGKFATLVVQCPGSMARWLCGPVCSTMGALMRVEQSHRCSGRSE